jgi:glutamate synthase domain-containing protein 3
MGCVMARQCHLNTCPVGIATQDQALRTRFAGKPEMVVAFFQGIAADVRAALAALGARSLAEVTGRGDEYLRARDGNCAGWIESLLQPPARSVMSNPRPAGTRSRLARRLTRLLDPRGALPKGRLYITNEDRSIGAALSGEVVRRFGASALAATPAGLEFEGVAGQSFGAFLAPGITLRLHGEGNDYVGKGLSGGVIAVTAGQAPSLRGDVLVGNATLYGATAGELFVAGVAGERFAVRNSGALAVAEGVGDHGCEYMTGGIALILGATGINFGSGMTGGLAYMLEQHLRDDSYNKNFVRAEACSYEEERWLRLALQKHLHLTWSPQASRLLAATSLSFARLEPVALPCPVHQTWANVLPRLQATPSQEALAVGMALRGAGRGQSAEVAG